MSVPKKLAQRAHVDVNDRRLKPIYESLDNGDNKKAIQEAERVLKKAKQMSCAKALKCLALIRLGRKPEARGMLSEIRKVSSIDDSTLQALTACYKELPDFEQIVSMYEESLVSNPNDEATLTQLFNAYVRVGDFHNQQQTAMKLYKLFPSKTPYLFWVILSYVMMSSKDPNVGKKVYLPLAEVMTLKYLKEAKHESESELMVYMMILEKQNKYKELLDVLKGPMGAELTQNLKYKTLLLLKTLKNLENWKELNTTYKRLLLENLDDIAWYREYLKYALVLLKNPPSDASLSTLSFHPVNKNAKCIDDVIIKEDESVESMVAFLNSCIELANNSGEGYTYRAPYLAKLELIVTMKSDVGSSWDDNLAPQYLELLLNYFNIFGDKPCCLNDLKKFFDVLTQEEREKMRGKFKKSLEDSIGSFLPENYKSMHRSIFSFQADHYLGFHDNLSTEEQLDIVANLLELHHHGLKFGEHLTPTDIQPADPYLLLSGEVLFSIAMKSDDMQHLVRAISILESGLEKSPSNHFMKLLLVKYHVTLGTMSQGYHVFETLDVKYIQNDTLGYIILNPLLKYGKFQSARKFCDTALKFYDSVQRETTDFIISCYKYGTFDKVKEFVNLKRKITRSIQYASISANKLMLSLISTCHDYKATEELVLSHDLDNLIVHGLDISRLIDNRDFTVTSHWKLYGKQTDGFQEQSLAEEKAWLSVQTVILSMLWRVVKETRLMSIQLNGGNSSNDGSVVINAGSNDVKNAEAPNSGTDLISSSKKAVSIGYEDSSDAEDVVDDRFSSFTLLAGDDPHASFQRAVCRAREVNNSMKAHSEYFFMTPLKTFLDGRLDASFSRHVEFFDAVVRVLGDPSFDQTYSPSGDGSQALLEQLPCLKEGILIVQHLSHLAIIMNACASLLQPFKINKKGKKKSKQIDIPNILREYNSLSHGLLNLYNKLDATSKNLSDELPHLVFPNHLNDVLGEKC